MKNAQLVYSIVCDDVRLEMGNKLSLMGIFENIFFQGFPSALLKFAIVNHWIGEGQSHARIGFRAAVAWLTDCVMSLKAVAAAPRAVSR